MHEGIIFHSPQSMGKTSGASGPRPMGESLTESLKDRRVLMVARDVAVADQVAAVLTGQGVTVQRVTADDRGLATERLADEDGQPLLPTGTVTLADIDTWRASMDSPCITRTADAIDTIVRSSQAGSTVDHLMLLVSQEDALRDCGHVLNLLMDRMVEADLVDQVGGVDGVSPMIRRFMRWLPQAGTGEIKTRSSRAVDVDVVLAAPTGQASRAIQALAAARDAGTVVVSDIGTRGSANPACNPDFEDGWPHGVNLDDMDGYKLEMSMATLNAPFDRMHLDDGQLDRLFGDEALERERRARMTIVCREERMSLRDIAFERVDLPAAGFDHRAVNEQFNQRRAIRGSRNDRRTNRGGRGRR